MFTHMVIISFNPRVTLLVHLKSVGAISGGEIQNARPAVSLNWLGDEEISEVPAKWNVKLHQKLCVDILGFTLLSMAGFISRMRL